MGYQNLPPYNKNIHFHKTNAHKKSIKIINLCNFTD